MIVNVTVTEWPGEHVDEVAHLLLDLIWTVKQETEHHRFNRPDYDMVSDHLWDMADHAETRLKDLGVW